MSLRGWRDADAPAIAAICDEREITRWTRLSSPYGESDARAWLATHPALLQRREELPLAVVDAGSDEVLGSISVRLRPDERGELGYLVGAHARGRGVATRAVRLLARYAFAELGRERLEIMVQPGNAASLLVAERAGFRREGVLRSHARVKGERVDLVMLSLLRDEL